MKARIIGKKVDLKKKKKRQRMLLTNHNLLANIDPDLCFWTTLEVRLQIKTVISNEKLHLCVTYCCIQNQ